MKKTIYLAMLLLALVSCKGKPTGQEEGNDTASGEKVMIQNGLPVIDLQKEYPKEEINLQDIADVEYIPLETKDDALLVGMHNLCMDDHTIVTTTFKTGDILLFDRKGKHLKTFNHKGQGSNEYMQVWYITADFAKKEVFVFDWRPGVSSSIKVYSFEGDYLRTLSLPVNWKIAMYDYDAEHLLIEDYGEVDRPGKPRYVNLTPYCLVSKKTGKLKKLPVQLKERMRDRLSYRKPMEGGVMSFAISFDIYPMAKSGDKALIADFTSDTIYTYQADKLIPFALKSNRITSFESTVIAGAAGWNDRYLLLKTQDKRTKEEINLEVEVPETGQEIDTPDERILLYDRQTNMIKEVVLSDANMQPDKDKNLVPELAGYELPEGYSLLSYRPDQLLEKHEKGELKGELAELANTLQEDDNHVLVLVKLKE